MQLLVAPRPRNFRGRNGELLRNQNLPAALASVGIIAIFNSFFSLEIWLDFGEEYLTVIWNSNTVPKLLETIGLGRYILCPQSFQHFDRVLNPLFRQNQGSHVPVGGGGGGRVGAERVTKR